MKLRLPVILVLFFVLVLHAFADYQKGLDAAMAGDFATALKEWKPLAEQGYADAQFTLGEMYTFGEGVLEDYVSAYMWFNLASSLGNEGARAYKASLAEIMTSTRIEKAQDLSIQCYKSNYKDCY